MLKASLGVLVSSMSASATAVILWDNNIVWDEIRAIGISPPFFENQRVVDDFVVPAGPGWRVTDLRFHILEDNDWSNGGFSEVFIHAGARPGNETYHATFTHERAASGQTGFGRRAYYYRVSGLDVSLEPGTYWIGIRHPFASGGTSSYWVSSNGLPDGPGQMAYVKHPPGTPDWVPWLSTTAFEIYGSVVPEPATGLALGALVWLTLGRVTKWRARPRALLHGTSRWRPSASRDASKEEDPP